MPVCMKCQRSFPNRMVIDGRERILNKRRYCTDCSPFGSNNRSRLPGDPEYSRRAVACRTCGRDTRHLRNGAVCSACYARVRRERIRDRLAALCGVKCLLCGYGDRERFGALEFHHVDAGAKLFAVNAGNAHSRSRAALDEEVRKCVLLCCRCHREFHLGLIEQEKIDALYREQWGL